jgi:hypothetical protein
MRMLMMSFGAKANPMFRLAALLWVFLAMHGAATAAEDDKQDTVEVHGKSLTLSCAEWKRNQDGSWTNTGPLLVGTETVKDVTLRGAKETNALEAKCANGSRPAAAPARTDEAPKHGRHHHPSAEPTNGT